MIKLPEKLWKIPTKWFWFGIPIGGLLALIIGAVGVIGFNVSLHATSTEKFCTSCHEMQTPYEEFKTTHHYSSQSGVQASCSDCHVPQEFVPKMIRKIEAAREVYHHLLGTYDTPEKFKAHRREMAEREWARMTANDSATCRSCHREDRWDLEKQSKKAQKKHGQERKDKLAAKGEPAETCIDCHKGVAHEMPD